MRGIDDTIEMGSAPGRIHQVEILSPRGEENNVIRFSSFSLGDVFKREIQKFGRFAFHGKHSKGESSKRFVDEFVKIHGRCQEEIEAEGVRGGETGKMNNSRGLNEKSTNTSWARPGSPIRPKFPYGTCMSHLVSHSWSDPIGSWLWVPRGEALVAVEHGLGFPARREEILRFEGNSRRVVRITSKQVDDRTFAEVAAMDTGRGAPPRRQGGMATHLGDRVGPVRSNEDQSSKGFEGNPRGRGRGSQDRERDQWNRRRTNQDLERGWPRGGTNNQSNNFQSGYMEERQRPDQNRVNPNKRQMDDRDRSDWEEQELRAKLRREQEERKLKGQGFWNNQREENWDPSGENKNVQGEPCYNCNMVGHLRRNCLNPPYCYCCKKFGHRSTVCLEKRGLRLCGYGILGQGFYSIRVPVDKETKKREVLGVMNIMSGLAFAEIIERELKHLFREVPRWTIKQMDSERYLIKFPTEEIRYQVAKFKSFEFETANVKAKVTPTDMSADAEDKLEIVWIKVHKFPPFARKEDIVMEIAYLVGDPIEVDLSTLNREGPISIKQSCRAPHKIGGETKVFFNGEGYNIRSEVERTQQESNKASPKFDRRKESDDEEEEKEEEGEFNGQDNFGSGKQMEGKTRPSYLD
jgi:hypothetical protein